jgi:membrane glycosyltransferase
LQARSSAFGVVLFRLLSAASQSSAVSEILLGRDAGWQVQRRDDGDVSHRDTIRTYAAPTLFGIAMAASAYAVSLPLLLWMMPVIPRSVAGHTDCHAVLIGGFRTEHRIVQDP